MGPLMRDPRAWQLPAEPRLTAPTRYDFLVPDVPSPHPCWRMSSTGTAVPVWSTGPSQCLNHGRCSVSVRCLHEGTGSGNESV